MEAPGYTLFFQKAQVIVNEMEPQNCTVEFDFEAGYLIIQVDNKPNSESNFIEILIPMVDKVDVSEVEQYFKDLKGGTNGKAR